MKCSTYPVIFSVALLLTMSSAIAQAADVDVIAKAAIGRKSSELITADGKFSPSFVTLDLSVTAATGHYFVTVNNEISIKDDIGSYRDPTNNSNLDGLIFYSREDTNITFGYSLDIATVFIGIRSGQTDAHYTANNSGFGTTSDGYYIGANKSYSYKDLGSFNGSLAIASLNGELVYTEPFVNTSTPTPVPPPASVKGSAVGVSVGIGWTGRVSDNTNYNLEYKLNQFNFNDDVIFGGLDLSYQENFTTFLIGLTHFF